MNTRIVKMDDVKVKLSMLWIVVMFNMLKADILSMYIPGALEEVVEFAGDTPVTQIMLGAAIIMEISIAMIFLPWVLKYRINRWANIIVGVLTIVWIWAGGATYPHYIFIATVETVCLLLIVWYAWKWPAPEGQS